MAAPNIVLPEIPDAELWALMSRAEELGLRLEMTEQGIVWETMPGLRHQELALAIVNGITVGPTSGDCECYRALDIYIRLSKRVTKRPDISIFCRRPKEEEGFVHAIPEAVIEITSPDSEDKDLISGPPLYLSHGIKDILVLDRFKNAIHHWSPAGSRVLPSPTTIHLACGCIVRL